MKILKICCVTVGAGSLLITTSLFASILGTGNLYITAPGYPPDQAGPYNVSITGVATGLSPGGSFETFCVGTQVDYTPNSPYSYQISDTVQPSGGSPGGNVGPPAYVTWGTAYLYSQYRADAPGYGYNSVPENTELTDALQMAIWDLQGQSTSGIALLGSDTPSVLNPEITAFLTGATNAATAAGVTAGSDAYGAFGVYALNMMSGSTYVQPELCVVPEPTTLLAGGLMLLPFGASALRIARKRLA